MFVKVIFVIVGVAIAASAVKQGDDASLSKERKELSEERREITEMFRRETQRLRHDDHQLRAKLDELQGQNKKLQGQNDNLHGKLDKQQEQMAKLQKENLKQIAELRMLRRADSKIKKVIRQRDQNDTREFDTKIKQSLRQNDVTSEIKKMMRNEINNFLINEKICVAGYLKNHGADNGGDKTVTVPFGRVFPRKPTVVAALSYVDKTITESDNRLAAHTYVKKTTNSTADIRVITVTGSYCYVSWMACL